MGAINALPFLLSPKLIAELEAEKLWAHQKIIAKDFLSRKFEPVLPSVEEVREVFANMVDNHTFNMYQVINPSEIVTGDHVSDVVRHMYHAVGRRTLSEAQIRLPGIAIPNIECRKPPRTRRMYFLLPPRVEMISPS